LAVAAIDQAAAGASELPGPNPPPPARHCAQTPPAASLALRFRILFIRWRASAARLISATRTSRAPAA